MSRELGQAISDLSFWDNDRALYLDIQESHATIGRILEESVKFKMQIWEWRCSA